MRLINSLIRHLVFAFRNWVMQAPVTEFMKGNLGRYEIATESGQFHVYPQPRTMICGSGGGTVDLAVHKIIGSLNNLENVEVYHPDSLDAASSAYFIETDQLVYMGESDVPLHLLYSRTQCSLRADLIHILRLIDEQIRRKDRRIDALLLMGGFSEGEYLFKCVDTSTSMILWSGGIALEISEWVRNFNALYAFTRLRKLAFTGGRDAGTLSASTFPIIGGSIISNLFAGLNIDFLFSRPFDSRIFQQSAGDAFGG
ncbi:hypothetical protein BS47DRAFT_1370052 [Hydnum rufescens UP504]|uniref:Uncharacterized protein n=1 Tax=Hydnum rufescens UP504 TaxID=1448309 RepID=A0A9P6ACS3_9AGAM|nr:hypothetical protein BS47DRAFT_1370052 [Hydnum rufescens UP504]